MNLQLPNTNYIPLVIALAAATAVIVYTFNKKKKRNWIPVATVEKLFLYPIKSCARVSVEFLESSRHGLEFKPLKLRDRSLMLCYEDGQMITARQQPPLVLVQIDASADGSIELSAPNMDPITINPSKCKGPMIHVRVWGTPAVGVDCGEEVSKWFMKFLDLDKVIKLIFHDKSGSGAVKRDKLQAFKHLSQIYTEDLVHANFQDFSPVNILSMKSVEDLQSRLNTSISEKNFRPNIFISGCDSYEEDNWRYLKIGTTELKFVKHCGRCILTTVDPETGVKNIDQQPLATLKEYRLITNEKEKKLYDKSPVFSNDFVPMVPGKITVGDTVYVSV